MARVEEYQVESSENWALPDLVLLLLGTYFGVALAYMIFK